MTTYREGLMASARVCASIRAANAAERAFGSSYHDGISAGAEDCECAILALAEQEDPAGQASPSVAAADSPQGAAAPALPGPMVSVPREPTEAMLEAWVDTWFSFSRVKGGYMDYARGAYKAMLAAWSAK